MVTFFNSNLKVFLKKILILVLPAGYPKAKISAGVGFILGCQ